MNNIEIPNSIQIGVIGTEKDCIYHFKNNLFNEDAPAHYHISVPLNDDEYLLLVFTTSKATEKKEHYKNKPDLLNSLITLKAGELDFLTASESVIDCNRPLFYTKAELETIIPTINFIKCSIPDSLIKEIKTKITNSTMVKPLIKKKIAI